MPSTPTAHLQRYVTSPDYETADFLSSTMPQITVFRTYQSLNMKKRTPSNGDTLEFLGDSSLHLATTLFLMNIKEQYVTTEEGPIWVEIVTKVLTSNWTLGWISFKMGFSKHLETNKAARSKIQEWITTRDGCPPRPLPDVLEAWMQAIHDEHNFDGLMEFIRYLFTPLVPHATTDFRSVKLIYHQTTLNEHRSRDAVLDNVDLDRCLHLLHSTMENIPSSAFISLCQPALKALESRSPRIKIVDDQFLHETTLQSNLPLVKPLIRYATTHLLYNQQPEVTQSIHGGAHYFTSVTKLVTHESIFSLFATKIMLHRNFERRSLSGQEIQPSDDGRVLMFYAMVVNYYIQDKHQLRRWLTDVVAKIVLEVDEILLSNNPLFQPDIPSD